MPVAGSFLEERKEVEAVLQSGALRRAPGLEQLFVYITTRYFDGTVDDLKEYTIAVEAFGRPADFDQKRDSIVRVQAHRLRERLAEYYENEGADHGIHITIPNGHYAPRFILNLSRADAAPEATRPSPLVSPTLDNHRPESARWRRWLDLLVRRPPETDQRSKANGFSSQLANSVSGNAIRIVAGLTEGEYIDNSGRVWSRDQHFYGGAVFSRPEHLIFGTREQKLFRSGREGNFRYDIPVKPGVYELRLYFAETVFGETGAGGFGGEATRYFDVLVNAQTVIHALDVIGEAGASAANIKVLKDVSPAPDGMLHLSFLPLSYIPFLNAVEITPGIPGRLQHIRMVAQAHGYIDKMGNYWEPDHRHGTGGQLVRPGNEATEVPDPGIYAGGRFGNLIYTIPVTPGRYALRLHLSERWPSNAKGRHFDILCNGVALERKFSALKRTGSLTRGLVQTFERLEPNHQGKLVLSLVPNPDFALINALEVVDQTIS
jgi:Malectin domain